MAFVLPKLSRAAVPFVQEGARSPRFELVRIVDGEVDGIFAVEGRPGFVVKASNRLWRFDEQGHLLDLGRRASTEACGVRFEMHEPEDSTGSWRAFRREWLLTGSDEAIELPLERIDSEDRARVDAALKRADVVVPLGAGSSRVPMFRGLALRSGGLWSGMDLSSWSDSQWWDLPIRSEEVKDRGSELWEVHELVKGHALAPSRLRKAEMAPLEADSSEPLEAIDFSRRGVEFSEGFGLWVFWKTIGWWLFRGLSGQPPYAYWSGVGTFALKHQGDVLKFRATAALGELGEDGVTAGNLRLVDLPGGLRLLRVTGPGMEHSKFYEKDGLTDKAHDEVGLYLVRTPRQVPSNALSGTWLPDITGPTWGTWEYPSGFVDFGPGNLGQTFAIAPESLSESQDDLPRGGRVVPQPFRQIPSSLRLRLPVRHRVYPAALAVDLGEGRWFFLAHDDGARLEVSVDASEFSRAWERLGGGNLRLVADFEPHKERLLDEGGDENEWIRPSLALVKGKTRVELELCRWTAPAVPATFDRDDRVRFLQSRSWQAGKLARAGKLSAAGWIEVTRDLLLDPDVTKEKSLWLVHAANELLNRSNLAHDTATSSLMVDFWINELHPKVRDLQDPERVKMSSVLTSNSLGNAIVWKDTARCEKILRDLVDPDPETIRHGTLHYNLACYHAWRQDRASMIAATRRALRHGKPASQFRADPDFAPWLADAEFVKVLDETHPER
jgi:hypothetical protein